MPYKDAAPKMESNKQERSNLLHDNPVAKMLVEEDHGFQNILIINGISNENGPRWFTNVKT